MDTIGSVGKTGKSATPAPQPAVTSDSTPQDKVEVKHELDPEIARHEAVMAQVEAMAAWRRNLRGH